VNGEVDFVLASQGSSGAFRSTAVAHGESHEDENAFVTALVTMELSSLPCEARIEAALARACEFLSACRHERGGFGFYPLGREPRWIGGRIFADADDTSLCTALLVARGVMREDEARQIIDGLDPFRVHYRPESAEPWIERGAQRTWLDTRTWPNPVDLCVNANVSALLAQLSLRGQAYDAAWRTVSAGAAWFLMNPALLPRLTPFYPEAFELRDAVRRAVRAGAGELRPTLDSLDRLAAPDGADAVLCSSHGGAWRWSAPALRAARRLSLMHERRTDASQRFEEHRDARVDEGGART
jgi:hypothetical protein